MSEPIERQFIAVSAEAADDAQRHRRDVAVVAERLTLVDVGEMHLDDRRFRRLERIVQRNRGVGIGGGIENDAARLAPRLLDPADQLALDIALAEIDGQPQCLGPHGAAGFEVGFPRFCGQTFLEAKDRELAEACVYAYNDWMVEEWCGDSGGALVPLPIIPLWDANLAAAEVRRNASRGARAVCFSEIPPHLGLPSIHSGYWDPFFIACSETQTVVCMHIGSSSRMPSTSSDAPAAVQATLSFGNAMSSMTDFLFSGVLVRFPELKLAYSEGQIGWVPYILERADDVWHEHRAWAGVKDLIPEAPSSYYYRQIYTCFFRDRHGIDSLDKVGIDNVTFETDYPHTDSTWPNTLEVATDLMGHLTPEQQYKIVRGNAIRMLGLDIT